MALPLQSMCRCAYRFLRMPKKPSFVSPFISFRHDPLLTVRSPQVLTFSGFSSRVIEATSSDSKQDVGAREKRESPKDESEERDIKERILDAALLHVSEYGWSEECLAAGARDLGLSSAAAGMFDGGAGEFVERYVERCNRRMAQKLQDPAWVEENDLSKASTMVKLEAAVRMRIEMNDKFHSTWSQAMALQTLPQNLAQAVARSAKMVDEMWHFAGDKSANINWYAKRGILATTYHSTELFWLTDTSKGRAQTWRFLQKTLKDAVNIESGISDVAQQVSQSVNIVLQTASSIFPFRR